MTTFPDDALPASFSRSPDPPRLFCYGNYTVMLLWDTSKRATAERTLRPDSQIGRGGCNEELQGSFHRSWSASSHLFSGVLASAFSSRGFCLGSPSEGSSSLPGSRKLRGSRECLPSCRQ